MYTLIWQVVRKAARWWKWDRKDVYMQKSYLHQNFSVDTRKDLWYLEGWRK